MQELSDAIKKTVKQSFDIDAEPVLTRPEEKFGDYSTNVALQLAGRLKQNPQEIAQKLAGQLSDLHSVEKVEPVSGFLNITLSQDYLNEQISAINAQSDYGSNSLLNGQEIVLEHTDPNPFKEFHIGHAYSNTIGVAIGRLLQNAGAKVHQVSYHGDIGLHIAMAIYGLKQSQNPADLGSAYAYGANAYQDNHDAKEEIESINQHLYKRDESDINKLYEQGRQKSLEAFEAIYQRLGTKFEKSYFESEVAQKGVEIVKQNMGRVFEQSEGAVIYDGEKAGLHKRVFITKQELPTYEAKEIGLAFAKDQDYPNADKFIVITANEIDDYFKVLVAAIKEIDQKLGGKIRHLSHGLVKFPEGKMSSRTGNVKLFSDLESDIEQKIKSLYKEKDSQPAISLGAIKYEFLKHRIGSDFVFEMEESVSLQGNSGPYLQYAYARANSIVTKAGKQFSSDYGGSEYNESERSLARKITEFPEVVSNATQELMPHYIATYLYELAQVFNRFYEANRVIGDANEQARLNLVKAYTRVLKNGLSLLNIETLEHI
jgi:arginyl-tRNA synthetase